MESLIPQSYVRRLGLITMSKLQYSWSLEPERISWIFFPEWHDMWPNWTTPALYNSKLVEDSWRDPYYYRNVSERWERFCTGVPEHIIQTSGIQFRTPYLGLQGVKDQWEPERNINVVLLKDRGSDGWVWTFWLGGTREPPGVRPPSICAPIHAPAMPKGQVILIGHINFRCNRRWKCHENSVWRWLNAELIRIWHLELQMDSQENLTPECLTPTRQPDGKSLQILNLNCSRMISEKS